MKSFIKHLFIFILLFGLISVVPIWLSFQAITSLIGTTHDEPKMPKRSAILQDPACLCGYDDSISLDKGLTKAYPLAELHNFFLEHQFYTSVNNGIAPQTLRYSEINQRYPVEITRSIGYSVYRVKEGGYYYLFWNYTFEEDESDDNSADRSLDAGESIDWGSIIVDPDPILYYSTYIPEPDKLRLSDFRYVKANEQTAYDISQIDPYCEFWLYPTGKVHERWSFSYLNAAQILRITYQYIIPEGKHISSRNDLSLSDMIVIDAEIIDRSDTPSFFSEIYAFDLPK